jgi:hypothetical protein
MITGIKKFEHGFTDYSYIPLVLLAPNLAGFNQDKTASIICRSFALGVLGVTLFTDAPWGLIKKIPYKTHAALDLATGIMSLSAMALKPIAKNKTAQKTFLVMALIGIVVGTLSLIGAKHE